MWTFPFFVSVICADDSSLHLLQTKALDEAERSVEMDMPEPSVEMDVPDALSRRSDQGHELEGIAARLKTLSPEERAHLEELYAKLTQSEKEALLLQSGSDDMDEAISGKKKVPPAPPPPPPKPSCAGCTYVSANKRCANWKDSTGSWVRTHVSKVSVNRCRDLCKADGRCHMFSVGYNKKNEQECLFTPYECRQENIHPSWGSKYHVLKLNYQGMAPPKCDTCDLVSKNKRCANWKRGGAWVRTAIYDISVSECAAECRASGNCNMLSWGKNFQGRDTCLFTPDKCSQENIHHSWGGPFFVYKLRQKAADPIAGSSVYKNNMKCQYDYGYSEQWGERLYREGGTTLTKCGQKCKDTPGCRYYSFASSGQYKGVCMGCDGVLKADSHAGFTLYKLSPSACKKPTCGMRGQKPCTTTTTSMATCKDAKCEWGYEKISVGPCRGSQCKHDECCEMTTTTTTTPASCTDYICADGNLKVSEETCGAPACEEEQCCGKEDHCKDYKCGASYVKIAHAAACGSVKCARDQCCVKEETCGDFNVRESCGYGFILSKYGGCGKATCGHGDCCAQAPTYTQYATYYR